jgi:hypothetical protein
MPKGHTFLSLSMPEQLNGDQNRESVMNGADMECVITEHVMVADVLKTFQAQSERFASPRPSKASGKNSGIERMMGWLNKTPRFSSINSDI